MSLVSLVVPVYRVEPYICRCIDSILNQSFSDFDMILVDDGSPDNCGSICDEYASKDNRIAVIHKENGGLSDARNVGIEYVLSNSNSEWITFIDSDDWVSSDYLQVLLDICKKENVSIGSCGYQMVRSDHQNVGSRKEYYVKFGTALELIDSTSESFHLNISVAWGRLYKKELFENVRFPKGRYYEDEYIVYKLLFDQDRIVVTNQPLYYYYQNENGIIASEFTPKKMNDRLDVFYEQIDYYYTQRIVQMFQRRLEYYCFCIYDYSNTYGKGSEYKRILKNHRKKTKKFIKEHREYLPDLLVRYGYNKWISGRASVLNGFKSDYQRIRQENGLLFAFLWAIKNYWNL